MKVNDAADQLVGGNALHTAFSAHLRKVSAALRAVEWVLSGDSSPGSENEEVLQVISAEDLLQAAKERVAAAKTEMTIAIEELQTAATLVR